MQCGCVAEAEELGETFFVVAPRAGEIAVLDKVEGTGVLRAAPRVGSTVPVHATAGGKLCLSFAPDEVRPVGSEHQVDLLFARPDPRWKHAPNQGG